MASKPQFSLRLLLVAIAAVAVIAAEVAAFPGWMAAIAGVALTSLLIPAFVAGIIYARGYTRAFCIGASAWWLAAQWMLKFGLGLGGAVLADAIRRQQYSMINQYGENVRIDYCLFWSLLLAAGLTAVVVRWLVLGRADDEQPRSGDRV